MKAHFPMQKLFMKVQVNIAWGSGLDEEVQNF